MLAGDVAQPALFLFLLGGLLQGDLLFGQLPFELVLVFGHLFVLLAQALQAVELMLQQEFLVAHSFEHTIDDIDAGNGIDVLGEFGGAEGEQAGGFALADGLVGQKVLGVADQVFDLCRGGALAGGDEGTVGIEFRLGLAAFHQVLGLSGDK